jgi:hypothetical protein
VQNPKVSFECDLGGGLASARGWITLNLSKDRRALQQTVGGGSIFSKLS